MTGNRLLGMMTRPLRFEFEGSLYHITSRGDRRKATRLNRTGNARFACVSVAF